MKFIESAAIATVLLFAAASAQAITFEPTFQITQSEKVYGTLRGDSTHYYFQCPEGSYVNKFEGVLTDMLNGLKMTCSDAARTSSECRGAHCDKLGHKSAFGVYGSHNNPISKSIESAYGFSNLLMSSNDQFILAMVSNVAGTDLQLIPDNDQQDGNWDKSVFPSEKDKSFGTHGMRITGGSVWTDGAGVKSLRPTFRILSGPAPADVLPAPQVPMPAFTGYNKNFYEQLAAEKYGGDGGNEFEFKCQNDAFITAITGVVSNDLLNVAFECSDGSKSQCHGKHCGEQIPGQSPGAFTHVDKKGVYRMTSATGFGQMEFYSDTRISGIRSFNAVGNVLSDQPHGGNDWKKFPSDKDPNVSGVIITGFKYRTGDTVDMMQPYYKVLAKSASASTVQKSTSTQSTTITSVKANDYGTVSPIVYLTPCSTSSTHAASPTPAPVSQTQTTTPCSTSSTHAASPTPAPVSQTQATTPCSTSSTHAPAPVAQAPSPAPVPAPLKQAPAPQAPVPAPVGQVPAPVPASPAPVPATGDYGKSPSPAPAQGSSGSPPSYGGLTVTPAPVKAPSQDADLPYCDEVEYGSNSTTTSNRTVVGTPASTSNSSIHGKIPDSPQLGASTSSGFKFASSLLSLVVAFVAFMV